MKTPTPFTPNAPSTPCARLAELRAETEAVRERIWSRWQAWALVFAAEQRVGGRHG